MYSFKLYTYEIVIILKITWICTFLNVFLYIETKRGTFFWDTRVILSEVLKGLCLYTLSVLYCGILGVVLNNGRLTELITASVHS